MSPCDGKARGEMCQRCLPAEDRFSPLERGKHTASTTTSSSYSTTTKASSTGHTPLLTVKLKV